MVAVGHWLRASGHDDVREGVAMLGVGNLLHPTADDHPPVADSE